MRQAFHPLLAAAAVGAACAAPAAFAAEYATVVSSTPVTATVPVPRQTCSDSQQIVQQAPSGAGAVAMTVSDPPSTMFRAAARARRAAAGDRYSRVST